MEVQKILSEWQAQNDWAHVEHSKECSACGHVYISGDVAFVYPSAVAIKIQENDYQCAQCGFKTLVEGVRPLGMCVVIQKEHLRTEMPLLAADVRKRIEEAFDIVDRLMGGLEAAALEGRPVTVGKAKKMIEEAEAIPEDWKLPDPT